jgi:hypothetical protein
LAPTEPIRSSAPPSFYLPNAYHSIFKFLEFGLRANLDSAADTNRNRSLIAW